jgi:uncharacterized membrane protein
MLWKALPSLFATGLAVLAGAIVWFFRSTRGSSTSAVLVGVGVTAAVWGLLLAYNVAWLR